MKVVIEDAYEVKFTEEELKELRAKTLARRKDRAPNASEKNIASNLYSKQSYKNYGHDGSQSTSPTNSGQIGSGTSQLSAGGDSGAASSGSSSQ